MKDGIWSQISFNGRVAYAINCFENTLISLNKNTAEWNMVLEILWSFTDSQYIDEWAYRFNEIVPDNLTEFADYKEHEYEYLEEDEFIYLYRLYQDIEEEIRFMLEAIHDLAISHIYSRIIGVGEESLEKLLKIIEYMKEHNFILPDYNKVLEYKITECNGFGRRFDGKKISIILK